MLCERCGRWPAEYRLSSSETGGRWQVWCEVCIDSRNPAPAPVIDPLSHYATQRYLWEKLTLLTGEIDQCRRDVSAWKRWLDEWAPRLRQLWDGGAGLATGEKLTELRGKIGWLEDCADALDAHAQVTVGRLESLEQALCEWNVASAPFSDRLAALEDRLSRIEERLPE